MSHGRGQHGDRSLVAAPITRRRFMEAGAGAGAGLLVWRFVGGRAWAQPLGVSVLDAGSIPKYATSLVIPPAMPRSGNLHGKKGRGVDYYRIGVRQFEQEILPPGMGLGPTKVWSYGSVDHPETFNYPAFTIEAAWRRPVRVKWINQLVKPDGSFRPHLFAVDQTLHWANPPGGIHGRDGHGTEPRPVPRPGPDRHAPARRSQRSAERRLPGGLVPAEGAPHPAALRQGGLEVPAVPGARAGRARPGVDSRERRVPVRQRPARGDDVVPRPHARDDAPQRLRGAGRLLPAARRARRRGRRDAARPGAGARRPAGAGVLRDPARDPGPLLHRRGRALLPGQPRLLRGARSVPAADPVLGRPRLRRPERRRADLEPGVLRQRDRRQRANLAQA